jgi:phosphate transport system substrate-binding protein
MKMITTNKILLSFLILLIAFYFGCTNSDAPSDTPTTGELTLTADETYQPLIDSEVDTFNKIYTYADVKVRYKPETEAFNDLMNDSVRLIIVPRKLNKEELKQFEKWEIVPRVTKIAYDAVALIGSKDLQDSTYSIYELKTLLSVEGKNSDSKKIKVVFDNNNSSTISFLKEKTGVTKFSSNCYALNSSKAVLDYVAKEKNAIGIIGVNWISDKDDTTNFSFLKTAKVIAISPDANSEALKPYQAYIAQKTYPLYREVYMVSKEAYAGLGAGFTAFVASERGQRIVLKFGLVPATMPVRLVELINEEL